MISPAVVDGFVNIVGVKFTTWLVFVILLNFNPFKIGGIMVTIKLLSPVAIKVNIPLKGLYYLSTNSLISFSGYQQ